MRAQLRVFHKQNLYTGVEIGANYVYRVRAKSAAEVGEWSELINVSLIMENGTGTIDDPLLIYSIEDLQAMANNLEAHYALMRSIDLSNIAWEPIGT
ncbi:hypothetical protein F8153_07310, partial [Alkaliphilus serpentinus]